MTKNVCKILKIKNKFNIFCFVALAAITIPAAAKNWIEDSADSLFESPTETVSKQFQPIHDIANCYDPSRLQNEVLTQFKITSNDPALQYKYCDNNNVVFQAIQALLYLKDLPPVLASNDEMDFGVLGTRPYEFLQSHINEIAFEIDGGDGCFQGTMAYIENRLPTMHICPWITKFDTLTNAGVFIHESRHVDGYPHVHCEHGPYQNFDRACDPSYQTLGSYGVGTEFEVKISRSQTINNAVRMSARGYAITDFMEHFNELPLNIRQGILLESGDNSVDFYDGHSRTPIIGARPINQVFFATSSTRAGFFNPDDLSIEYFQSKGVVLPPSKSGLQDELRNRISQADASTLLDMAFISDGACFLFPKHLHCFHIGNVASSFDVPLNGLLATSFVSIERSMIFNSGDVYLATDQGLLHRLPQFDQLRNSDPFDYPRAPGSLDVLSIAQINPSQEILMRSNHLLQVYDTRARNWQLIPGLESTPFKKMVGPYYWSEKLDSL